MPAHTCTLAFTHTRTQACTYTHTQSPALPAAPNPTPRAAPHLPVGTHLARPQRTHACTRLTRLIPAPCPLPLLPAACLLLLLLSYTAYLVFQLKTHHDLFSPDDDQEAEPILSLTTATLLLTVITVIVAFASE